MREFMCFTVSGMLFSPCLAGQNRTILQFIYCPMTVLLFFWALFISSTPHPP